VYNFENITSTAPAKCSGGTVPLLCGDDQVNNPIPLGFSFTYYGVSYTTVYICTNGFIAFANPGSNSWVPTTLSNAAVPNGVVAPFWTDFNIPNSPAVPAALAAETRGVAPNRYAIVQWSNVPYFSAGPRITVQVKAFETLNTIEVHVQQATADTSHLVAIGIENPTGTVGTTHSFDVGQILFHWQSDSTLAAPAKVSQMVTLATMALFAPPVIAARVDSA